jgi:PAS domain S-box-containing protein
MISTFFDQLVSGEGFMPHGMCYLWQPAILALHVISDGVIALAYLTIPLTLVHFVRKRTDLQFNWIFLCFAAFIIACAATHILEIWTIWHPAYWLSGAMKAITALASVVTSMLLLRLLPDALSLPSPSALRTANLELKGEIAQRFRSEENLRRANADLEDRVAERTAELEAVNLALKEENARFALATEAAGLGFWEFDIEANTFQWDEHMFRLHGLDRSEGSLPRARWSNCLHQEDRARCEMQLIEALSGGTAFESEFRVLHPSGGARHLRATARVVRASDGRALRMIGVNFDITESKRADERFRLAIDAAPTGMLMMDRAGLIVLVNAKIEAVFGYARDELLGRGIDMLVPERFRTHHPEFRAAYFHDPKVRTMGAERDLYGLRKDGSEVPVEIGLNPLHTSDGDFVLASIIDLSQERAMDRMRTDFISTVSHELRTPLTSISGSLGLLQAGAMGRLPASAVEMVRIAYKNSGRLVRIINDILDIGKLEAGQLTLHLANTPLTRLLEQSVEANGAFAEKCGVRLCLEAGSNDDRVLADPDRLIQVLTNLLSNAAKFSNPGADVLIRVLPKPTILRVEIEDFGAGIPEEFRARIFEKFARADSSTTRLVEGSGLGLSIARNLVEAMGGTIGFRSVAGSGTTFHIELPRAMTAPAESAENSPSRGVLN